MRKSLRIALFGMLSLGIAPRGAWSAAVIDSAAVNPPAAPVGVATQVLVTAVISDPSVLPDGVNLQRLDTAGRVVAVLGILRDDGMNGDAAAGDKTFTFRLTLLETTPGPITLRVSAAFRGSLTRAFSRPLTVNVQGATATGINILSPASLAYLNTSPVNVSGSVGDPGALVTVNGIPAAVAGGAFQLTVPLVEGNNTLTAVARNTGGTTNTSSIQVTLDTTPPHVTIESPTDNLVTTDTAVTVAGTVNDIVVGTVNSQQAEVTVNGIAAQVANRSFSAVNVPLALGVNTIQAVARDRSGNSAMTHVQVRRETPTRPFVRLVSGNNQSGPISTSLPAPLVVALADGQGHPVPNGMVVFKVTDNNGAVSAGGPSASSIAVTTNATGQAQASFRLGARAGAGSNRVEATATGFDGTAAFTETGVSTVATQINLDAGNNQTGALGEKLAFPFVIVVTDVGHNRIGGVPVTFSVKQGGGSFNGQPNVTMNTDPDGRSIAVLMLGTEPGFDNNVVDASFSGNPGLPATFVASAKTAGNAADTRISGVVLDNSNNPIAGVTMRLFLTNQGNLNNTPVPVGTPVTSDAQGVFLMQPTPVGFFKLMADGTTVAPPRGVFPTLEYDIVTVAGQNNTLGMPVYLPALDTVNRLCVNEITGGTLTLPQVPGFSLTVAAGAATFPGGARSGCITVSIVNGDKVPMAPGFGQQPRFIVTIQPVGTVFNPPAPITMPNVDGLLPGQVIELYSYDHDLSAFTAIGTGTVSADGLLVRSDPGVGILKAGWHCGGDPSRPGSAAPLSVTMSASPTATAGSTIDVTANGRPPLDGRYVNWVVVDDPADPDDDPSVATFVTTPACDNQPSCIAKLKGTKIGIASLRVTFLCTTTGNSVTSSIVKVRFTIGLTPKEVTFKDDIDVYKDQVGSAPKIVDPVWKDTNTPDQNDAVAYVRKSTMKVTVKFAVSPVPTSPVTNVTIEGEIAGLGKFKQTGVTIPAAAEMTVTDIVADTVLPDTTKFYNPMTIAWRHMADGKVCPNCTNDGSTANKVYVTLATPTQPKLYLSTLHLAVSKDGAADEATAATNSWSLFAGPANITSWDGRKLYYYRAGVGFSFCALDEESLLTASNGSGQCGSFAYLLIAVFATNGIGSEFVSIGTADGLGFLVQKWNRTGQTYPGDPLYKWSVQFNAAGDPMVPPQAGDVYGDLTNTPDLKGQNTAPPSEKLFGSHYIVKMTKVPPTLYYDPSYGATYTGATKEAAADYFETNAVEGYIRRFGTDPAGVVRMRDAAGQHNITFDK